MTEKREIEAADVVTYDGLRLWLASLPDEYEFLEVGWPTTESCLLAKFARAVWPRDRWVANGVSLVGYVPGTWGVAARIETSWTQSVPKAFDRAALEMTAPITAAKVRAVMPWLAP